MGTRRNAQPSGWARASCIALLACSACSGAERSAGPGPDARVADAADDRAFADVALAVRIAAYDDADDAVGLETRIVINGGSADGRLPELEVFADGQPLMEVGSAGVPQQFSYLYYPDRPSHGHVTALQFRLDDSRHDMDVEALSVEIVSPAPEATVAIGSTLRVRWTGVEQPPASLTFDASGCAVAISMQSVSDEEARYAVAAATSGSAPPCSIRLTAAWSVTEALAPAPFASYEQTRTVLRVRSFVVE